MIEGISRFGFFGEAEKVGHCEICLLVGKDKSSLLQGKRIKLVFDVAYVCRRGLANILVKQAVIEFFHLASLEACLKYHLTAGRADHGSVIWLALCIEEHFLKGRNGCFIYVSVAVEDRKHFLRRNCGRGRRYTGTGAQRSGLFW